MLHFRPEIIEQLTTLWVALPLKSSGKDDETDQTERQFAITDAYCKALRSVGVEAVRNTVDALCEGRIKEASKRFCPTAPELAEYAREEQRRLEIQNAPRAIVYQPVSRPWKDWNIIQRERTRELEAEGYVLFAERATQEQACNAARAKTWPIGTIWFWAIQEAWAPTIEGKGWRT